jgi:hypothetical protein
MPESCMVRNTGDDKCAACQPEPEVTAATSSAKIRPLRAAASSSSAIGKSGFTFGGSSAVGGTKVGAASLGLCSSSAPPASSSGAKIGASGFTLVDRQGAFPPVAPHQLRLALASEVEKSLPLTLALGRRLFFWRAILQNIDSSSITAKS